MTDTQILNTLADMLAERVAAVVEQRLRQSAPTAPPAEYDPTRRLSRREAARHLGISVRTLDGRVKEGKIWKYTPDGQAPYFLLGELDGNLSRGHKQSPYCVVFQRGMGFVFIFVPDDVPKNEIQVFGAWRKGRGILGR